MGLKTSTYQGKWLHVNSLSKEKQKEKGNNGYMPCCPASGTCSVFGSTSPHGPHLKHVRNYKVSMT